MNELVGCVCGRVHIVEPTSFGPMIACPEAPPAVAFLMPMKYVHVDSPRPPRIPRPEQVW